MNLVAHDQREYVTDTVHRFGIVGRSAAIADVMRRIDLVSATRSTVLITGETGTGKELVARGIHERSPERHRPFVRVNCAAIPETLLESELFGHVRGAFTDATVTRRGKFSLADRGSIFLDEIGTMSLTLQPKLLRVLQEREIEPLGAERAAHVDVRVIAATNRDLRQLVHEGRFHDDLFYRLNVIRIAVPPLRDRAEDIPLLVDHFVTKHAARAGKCIRTVESGVVTLLQQYDWPGNIRELENAIERAVVLTTGNSIAAEVVTFDSMLGIDRRGGPSLNLRENVEWIERETIQRALQLSTGGKQEAARLMGISPRALSYYLAKYPIIDGSRAGRPRAVVERWPGDAADDWPEAWPARGDPVDGAWGFGRDCRLRSSSGPAATTARPDEAGARGGKQPYEGETRSRRRQSTIGADPS